MNSGLELSDTNGRASQEYSTRLVGPIPSYMPGRTAVKQQAFAKGHVVSDGHEAHKPESWKGTNFSAGVVHGQSTHLS